MQVISLYSQCLDTLVKCFYSKEDCKIVLETLSASGIVQVFTSRFIGHLIEWDSLLVTDQVVDTVSSSGLRSFGLNGCTKVTAECVSKLLNRCQNIYNLDISHCDQLLEPEFFDCLFIQNLKKLKINGCNRLNGSMFEKIISQCPTLENLSLDECCNLGGFSSTCLRFQTFGSSLTSISMSGCKSVDNKFVRNLCSVTRSNLKWLDISYTSADCLALIYLAGFTLKMACQITNLKELGGTILRDVELNEELNDLFEYDQNMKCASPEIKCKDCLERQREATLIEDYYNIGNIIPCNSKTNYEDWDVISLSQEENLLSCTCKDLQQNKMTTIPIDPGLEKGQLFEPKLIYLDINNLEFYYNEFGRKCLELFMDSNKCLEHFFISWNNLDNEMLKCISKNDINLKTFHLDNCSGLIGLNWDGFGQYCHSLVDLNLTGASFLTDRAIIQLIQNNQNIRKLGLSEASISDEVVHSITDLLSEKLELIDLSWCENITNAATINLITKCTKLDCVNLRQGQVSSSTVEAIGKYQTNLSSIGLSGLKGLHQDLASQNPSLLHLTSLQKLTSIDLSWNCMVSDDTIIALFGNMPVLEEAVLIGLKCLSSNPFLPMIYNYKEWYRLKTDITKKILAEKSDLEESEKKLLRKNIHKHQFIEADFHVPFRSKVYQPRLKNLSLSYCDKVDDDQLSDIVSVCRGTLVITGYFGEAIEPKWRYDQYVETFIVN
ncbi:uncharacterized protein [Clytia hemisphaerica]|uniref:Uncharacterized protein n=1 Tax=Clytia hemisphaerica TaxID=252671 RepID=A0A7M6DNU7_9CNID